MRQMVLMEAWEDYVLHSLCWGYNACWGPGSRIETKVLSQYRILSENPGLAAYVRYCSPFAYLEHTNTSSYRSKDSSGGLHGRDCQNDGAFRQMSRRPTQPPHHRDCVNAGRR